MDQIVLYLAQLFGVNPVLLPVYLGLIVAFANVVGKSIPASATGPLGLLRGVLLVIGLYKSQQITSSVTSKTVSKALAAEVPDATLVAAANTLPSTIGQGVGTNLVSTELAAAARAAGPFVRKTQAKAKVQSHWLAGVGALIIAFLLMGCTTAQLDKATSVTQTVCTSVPLLQALYNTAVASGDHKRVNDILAYVQATCPAAILVIQTIPVQAPAPAPVSVGERG